MTIDGDGDETPKQRGQRFIEHFVEAERRSRSENAEGAWWELMQYADALEAEAALPKRRREWVRWARRRARRLRLLGERIDEVMRELPPDDG